MPDSSNPERPGGWRFRARAAAGTFAAAGLDEADARTLETAWSRCRPVVDAGDADDALLKHPGHDWEGFHERLVYTATGAAIESGRGDAVMLHGAALALPETGAAVALVAASGVGKTTATRVLGRHFGYLTDETVVVRSDAGIVPFPKPLSLLPPSGRRPKRQAGPDELGLLPAPAAPVLRRIAVLDRQEPSPGDLPDDLPIAVAADEDSTTGPARGRVLADGSPPAPTAARLPLSEALEHLAPQTSSLSQLPRGLCRLAELLDACGGALRLTYTEAETLVPLVRDLLSGAGHDAGPPADGHREWSPVPLGPEAPVTRVEAPGAGGTVRFRRAPTDDAISVDDARGHSLAVLAGERLLVLRGLGPLLWELAAVPRTAEDLLKGVVAVAGDHPHGARLLAEQLDTLVEHGVLLRG
ncbi:hypothetical protein [Zhihengliuella sp.]|uniref:hypothetical protein n=1 Tax=Zhihengliuella sp. TaxID=1954483 RepID=UPI0028116DFF|nr:hypothetical protein [Zhihengliuella sp.]